MTAAPISMEQHRRLLRHAALASISVAVVLVLVKSWALYRTGSVGILASLVDSFLDSLASVMSAFAVRYSLTPPDNNHRFGHGKAQALAGLAQAGVIVVSAVFLFTRAVARLSDPQEVVQLQTGIAVMLFAMIATACLVLFQRHVVSKTGSVAIKADSAHYWSDFLSNAVVLVALVGVSFGVQWLDPVLAIGIAIYIIWTALEIANHATQELMDRELPAAVQSKIGEVAARVKGVHGVHDIRTRRAGHIDIVQMHIVLDDDLRLIEAHEIADEVERAVRELRPGADVIIHQDPFSAARDEGMI